MMKKRLIIGSGFEENKSKFDKNKFYRILNLSLDRNIYHCDTADTYLKGNTQKIISKFSKKKKLKIINKFNLINNFETLKLNLDKSLIRLGVDYIDTYMPHWPNQDLNFNLLADFAEYAIEKKKINSFGLSNFNLKMIKNFQKFYKKKISVQFELNIRNYSFNKKLIKYCKNKNIDMLVYGISRNFPTDLKIFNQLSDYNPYEISLKWISSLKYISPIIKSQKTKNLSNNINAFKQPFRKNYKFNEESKIINVRVEKINQIYSGSGVVYKNLSEAKKNKYNLKPGPLEIAQEIKKNGLLKPFFFKKTKNGYILLSGQARYWAYRFLNKNIKRIKGILLK